MAGGVQRAAPVTRSISSRDFPKAIGGHRGCFRRWSVPERAKNRANQGPPDRYAARNNIQFDTELLQSAIAARHTRITQVAKSRIFLFSENMRPV